LNTLRIHLDERLDLVTCCRPGCELRRVVLTVASGIIGATGNIGNKVNREHG
jgi:hypothetical protein